MTGPDPAVAAIRLAVRHDLPLVADGRGGTWSPHVRPGGAVLVACSGGADSLALLAATVFETRAAPLRVIGTVVDHGLQEGSDEHTLRVVEQMAALGADETASIRVNVDPGGRGTEGAAREARYAALEQLADHFAADAVLLGHTLDDQAETVLLGLARGSGGRSLTGMRSGWNARPGADHPLRFSRPLLEVTRAQTVAACRAEEIEFWVDPHNADPRFLRPRVRHDVLPVLERELGPGVAAALARTGAMLRTDMDALDDLAEDLLREVTGASGIDTSLLEAQHDAVQLRTIRLALLAAGAPSSDLTHGHVHAVADLVLGADEGRQIQLPGNLTAFRDRNLLLFRPTAGH
jgi:tRNA(Ile)-lysidine synthase